MLAEERGAYLNVMFNQKDGFQECTYCREIAEKLANENNTTLEEIGYKPQMYWRNSQNHHTHMLFQHGIYMEPCKSFAAKVLEKNCILGFQLRDVGRKMKGNYRTMLRNRKMKLWGKYNPIGKWFDMIDIKYELRKQISTIYGMDLGADNSDEIALTMFRIEKSNQKTQKQMMKLMFPKLTEDIEIKSVKDRYT